MSNVKMNDFPELLSEEIMKRVEKLSSANICDGMIGLGIPREGCMDVAIAPVDKSMKTFGTAYTVNTDKGDNLPIHLALYTAKPGYVMVIDGKGVTDYPYFGDNMMSTGKAVGLRGMIVDGLVRDYDGCVELGFPVFAKGLLPRGPRKQEPGEINYPITCGGIQVNPGDLIVADADGVAVVPRDRIEEVLNKAEEKLQYDESRKALMVKYEKARLSGGELFDLAPQWVHDMLGDR